MIEKIVNRLEEGLIVLLLSAMTLLTFSQVVLRYVFNSGWTWALEATVYMFAWLVLTGIAYGIKVGFHIGIDAAVMLLPPGKRRAIGVVAALACLAYAVIMFIGGFNYVDTMHTLGVEAEDLPIQRWLLAIIVPIGFFMLGLRIVQLTWRILSGRQDGFKLGDEAADAIKAHGLAVQATEPDK